MLLTPIGNIPYFRNLEGQFILVDLFLLIARNWNFHDMFNLNINNIQSSIVRNPVSRNSQRIINFIVERIMRNQPPTNRNIEEAANRIYQEMFSYINIFVSKIKIFN